VSPPVGVRKVLFIVRGPAPEGTGPRPVALRLLGRDGAGVREREFDTGTINVEVRPPTAAHKRTFRSRIDGSVQYYALVPAAAAPGRPGLVLTLHGAAVEAIGQARSYAPKPGL